MAIIRRNNKGELEMDYIGKLIIGLIFLILLIVIVTVVIGGKFGNEEENIKGIFGFFK